MGITAGYLYAAYGFGGFLFHLAVILPGAFLSLIAIIIAAKESIRFSRGIRLGAGPLQENVSRETFVRSANIEAKPQMGAGNFFVRYAVLIGILIAAATADVLTTFCFSGLFTF